ncbi:histidine--tRNA ligase [Thermithiobacillus plumbiphilus]|uniref:Histidine--tRNA ligase n=1 Tax=Thermithiobacillus plumbiphilus TaxID=1729899 RepID=A0ABU9DCY3_9PROT
MIQAVRGMNDLLPEVTPAWQALEDTLRELLALYGYGELRLPILEKTQLFARAIGDVTDIVEKEMYTFADRNGESLTLRPEGTAGVVRAMIEHQRLRGQTPKVYYIGPMFRHERPQKGRYRQFHQVGVEAFGLAGPDIDAEQIALSAHLLQRLGLTDVYLEINSLGDPASRERHRQALLDFLSPHEASLCSDCQSRLQRSPLRVLDCKVETCSAIAQDAPSLLDFLDDESRAHFAGLQARLDALGIPFKVNTRLVRGLDYYNRTVFEWKTRQLGAQGTVIAGGRYDGLVRQIGGPDTPAVGFAAGLERLLALQEITQGAPAQQVPLLFLGALGEAAAIPVLREAQSLRGRGLAVVSFAASGLKQLFKAAERSNALYLAILGEGELNGAPVQVKPQNGGESFSVPLENLGEALLERRNQDLHG